MAMALDEPKDTDKTYSVNGVTYMIDTDLLDRLDNVKVDFVEDGPMRTGFSITSGNPLPKGSCGSGCSC